MKTALLQIGTRGGRGIMGLAAAAAAAVAGAQELRITDFTGRGFPPDLVEYQVRGAAARSDQWRVLTGSPPRTRCRRHRSSPS